MSFQKPQSDSTSEPSSEVNLSGMIARNKSMIVSCLEKLARVRSNVKTFEKLEANKLGTAEVEEFFLSLGYKRKGGGFTLGRMTREKTVEIVLKDKIKDMKKEESKANFMYHKRKEELRGLIGSEGHYRRTLQHLKESCEEYRKEVEEKNDRKLKHLKRKYRSEELEPLHQSLLKYKDIKIFSVYKREDSKNKEEEEENLEVGS